MPISPVIVNLKGRLRAKTCGTNNDVEIRLSEVYSFLSLPFVHGRSSSSIVHPPSSVVYRCFFSIDHMLRRGFHDF